MKIGIATGTRADWGLLQPLAAELRRKGADVSVIATHQHLISEMGNTLKEIINDGFTPDYTFPATGTAAEIMSKAATGASEALSAIRPDALVILGDRCEMLGVASAALLSGVPIVHIAGGTISEGAFDDAVRHAITKMATLHFPETPLSAQRILQMGEMPENVFTYGALGVENAMKIPRMNREALTKSLDGWDPGEKFLVVTLHAATLEKQSPLEVQEAMLSALEMLPEDYRFIITYPNSDIDPAPLIESLRAFEHRDPKRTKVIPSLGRVRYMSAAALSHGIVGNSSSGLVEIPSLGIGTLDIGNRQKGRECGESVIRCGTTREEISEGLTRLLSPEQRAIASKAENPYGGHDTAAKMARTILDRDFKPYPQKKFHLIKTID